MACGWGWSLAMRKCWRAMNAGAVSMRCRSCSPPIRSTGVFAVPGRLPSAVRRLGMGMIQRTDWLKRFFMNEARGMSGKLPELLQA